MSRTGLKALTDEELYRRIDRCAWLIRRLVDDCNAAASRFGQLHIKDDLSPDELIERDHRRMIWRQNVRWVDRVDAIASLYYSESSRRRYAMIDDTEISDKYDQQKKWVLLLEAQFGEVCKAHQHQEDDPDRLHELLTNERAHLNDIEREVSRRAALPSQDSIREYRERHMIHLLSRSGT